MADIASSFQEAPETPSCRQRDVHQTARLVLASFVLTFMCARILVFLIMSRRAPDLYVHAGGTHIHHLNYGIFLLSIIGAMLLFRHPRGRELTAATIVYGIGLGLTFDEFGMWLHLGGPYWQRASFDAIVVIAAILGLIAYAPTLIRFRPRHWITAVATTIVGVVFVTLLIDSFHYAQDVVGPQLMQIERHGPQ